MSKNLIKSYFLNRENSETKIIDTNELVAKRLEMIQSVIDTSPKDSSGFEAVNLFEHAPVADPLDVLSDAANQSEGVEGNPDSVPADSGEDVGPSREEILAEAVQEADRLKEEARAEIAAEKDAIYAAAKEEGYAAGQAEGMQQCEEMKAQLEEQKQRLLDSYEAQVEQLEPKFVSILTDIYEQVINYDIQDKKPLVTGMLRNALRRLDGC